MKTVSSREFTRDVAAAKQAAADGPVFITDRGQPAHVLITVAEYRRLTGATSGPTLLDAMDKLPGTMGASLPLPSRHRTGRRRVPDFGSE